MLSKVKENLFTLHGLITTLIHVFIVVGMIATFIGWQVEVMGHDVRVATNRR